MSDSKLTDFKFLVFDVYATLCDVEAGVYAAFEPLLSRYPAAKWSRYDVLTAFEEISWHIQAHNPNMLFTAVLAETHVDMEARLHALYNKYEREGHDVKTPTWPMDPSAHTTFANSVKDWPVFPDSSSALHELSKHYTLVVLSNVDRASFAHTHAKLSTGDSTALASPNDLYTYSPTTTGQYNYWFPQRQNPETFESSTKSPFSLILTAQDVHSYKPALAGFHKVLEVIQHDLLQDSAGGSDVTKDVLWVAQSLPVDIAPTHDLGITSVWIDRMGTGADEGYQGKYKWSFKTLGEMAEAVKKEKDQ